MVKAAGQKSITMAVQCEVEIIGTEPLVWRRFHILANSTLRTLQYTICDSLDWKYMHSYQFQIGDEVYGDPDLDYEFEGWLDDSKMTLGRVAKKVLEFEFIYDFSDDWRHRVVIEDVFPANRNERYPLCVGGANAAPPEECGGIVGFDEYKKSVKIVKIKKPRNLSDSIHIFHFTNGFDPHFFDLRFVNEVRLHRRKHVPRKN